MPDAHRLTVRVRYPEADPGGRAHHAVFLEWFEMGRTELMRGRGITYADMERTGSFIAVIRADVRYRLPVVYDEEVTVETWVDHHDGSGGPRRPAPPVQRRGNRPDHRARGVGPRAPENAWPGRPATPGTAGVLRPR